MPRAQAAYELVATLDDHGGAAITGLRFAAGGRCLVSCAANGSVVFRRARRAPSADACACLLFRPQNSPQRTPATHQPFLPLSPSQARGRGRLQRVPFRAAAARLPAV